MRGTSADKKAEQRARKEEDLKVEECYDARKEEDAKVEEWYDARKVEDAKVEKWNDARKPPRRRMMKTTFNRRVGRVAGRVGTRDDSVRSEPL